MNSSTLTRGLRKLHAPFTQKSPPLVTKPQQACFTIRSAATRPRPSGMRHAGRGGWSVIGFDGFRNRPPRTGERDVRTIFLSDCHLGSIHSRADHLLTFLESHRADSVYLVGDIVDGWALRRRWRWEPIYHRVLHRLLEWLDDGTRIYYAPGNHDEFLRDFLREFGFLSIAHEFHHRTVDGRKLLVVHGDQIDPYVAVSRWCSMLGSAGYDTLFAINAWINRWRDSVGLEKSRFGLALIQKLPWSRQFVQRWEEAAVKFAQERDCDGIICGHVHTPTQSYRGDFHYLNIGDWMENCTALVEEYDGTFRHVRIGAPDGGAEPEVSLSLRRLCPEHLAVPEQVAVR